MKPTGFNGAMFIPLDRDTTFPLSRQISAYLEEMIRRGHLGPGARLPATRTLARDLGVNRKTVEAAYDELRERRLVSMRSGQLARVRASIPENPELDLPFRRPRARNPFPANAWRLAPMPDEGPRDLAGDGPRLPCVSPAALRRFHREAVDGTGPVFSAPPPLGEPWLRRSASGHLARCGILRAAEEIVIARDRSGALVAALALFVSPGGRVLVDGPIDPDLSRALAAHGAKTVRLTERNRWERQSGREARALVVATTPSRMPGAVPGLARRKALLDFAREHALPVIEDVTGTDGGAGTGPPPLASLDTSGRILALCDLADEVGGDVTAAALAVPPKAIERLRARAEAGVHGPDRLAQRVLALALDSSGRTAARRALRERRELQRHQVRRSLRRRLPELAEFEFSAASDAVRLDLPEGVTGAELQRTAEAHGVRVRSARDCGERPKGDVYLGHDLTRLEEGELLDGIRRLGAAFDALEDAAE